MQIKSIFLATLMSVFIFQNANSMDEVYSFETAYQNALAYRDNKVPGYSKLQSDRIAERMFYTLTFFNHPKAIHNYAVIRYAIHDYPSAYQYFKKSQSLGVEASSRNIARMEKEGRIYPGLNQELDNFSTNQRGFVAASAESEHQMSSGNLPAAKFWTEQAISMLHSDGILFCTFLDICNYTIKILTNDDRPLIMCDEIAGAHALHACLLKFYPSEKSVREFVQRECNIFFEAHHTLSDHLMLVMEYCQLGKTFGLSEVYDSYFLDRTLASQCINILYDRIQGQDFYNPSDILAEGEFLDKLREALRLFDVLGCYPTAQQVNHSLSLARKLGKAPTVLEIEESITNEKTKDDRDYYEAEQAIATCQVDFTSFETLLQICNYSISILKNANTPIHADIRDYIGNNQEEVEKATALHKHLLKLYPSENAIIEFSQRESDIFFQEHHDIKEHLLLAFYYCEFAEFGSYLTNMLLVSKYVKSIESKIEKQDFYDQNTITDNVLQRLEFLRQVIRLNNKYRYAPTTQQVHTATLLTLQQDPHKQIIDPSIDQIFHSIRLQNVLGFHPTAAQINESVRLSNEIANATPLQIDHSLSLTRNLGRTPTVLEIEESITNERTKDFYEQEHDYIWERATHHTEKASTDSLSEQSLSSDISLLTLVEDSAKQRKPHNEMQAIIKEEQPNTELYTELLFSEAMKLLINRFENTTNIFLREGIHRVLFYLPRSQMYDISLVCKSWHDLAVAEYTRKLGLSNCLTKVRDLIAKKVAQVQSDDAYILLAQAIRMIGLQGYDCLHIFCDYLQLASNGNKNRYVITIGSNEEKEKASSTLQPWNDVLVDLCKVSLERTLDVFKQGMSWFVKWDRPRYSEKLQAIELLNTSVSCFRDSNKSSLFFDPTLAQSLLNNSLMTLKINTDDCYDAIYFFERLDSPTYASWGSSSSTLDSATLKQIILRKLADLGSPPHLLLYGIKYAEFKQILDWEGMGLQEPDWETMRNNMATLDASSYPCMDTMAPVQQNEPPKEVRIAMSFMFGIPIPEYPDLKAKYRVTNNEKDEYFKAAINKVIELDDTDHALSFFRLLSHHAGYIEMHCKEKPICKEITLNYNQALTGHSFQPYIESLQSYLNQKGLYNPPVLSGDQLCVQECNQLTPELLSIVSQVETSKSQWKNGIYMTHGDRYSNYYGPSLQTSNLAGRVMLCHGCVEMFEDKVTFEQGNLIIDGPAFIKTKQFTLLGDFDALNGAVIIAENFNLSGGRIWNPANCHLLKVADINSIAIKQMS